MRKNRILLASLFLLLLAAAGCNTVRGMGKDIHDVAMNTQEWIEGGNHNSTYVEGP